MDVLSKEIRNEKLWELLYADDLVITAENVEDLQRRIVQWQETLERGGLRVNVSKIDAIVSGKEFRDRVPICESRGLVIKQVKQFRYLGSIKRLEGGCETGVENRIKAAWGKWRKVAQVVCQSN
ncbi:uncharacterized protein [Palaemon carinicauda]|uniref:uncharacterized protein n=1 Tax=Palaemon carinicauda TaxID=392227 RepID=UPI0035B66AA0